MQVNAKDFLTFIGTSSMDRGLIVIGDTNVDTCKAAIAGSKDILGVVWQKANADGVVSVAGRPGDVAWVKLGGTVAYKDKLISDGNGLAVAAGTEPTTIAAWKGCVGIAMRGGNANDYIPVKLQLTNIAQ